MNFPIWEIPKLGGSGVIALVAVTHVFIAHFAVGGGLWLAVTEAHAARADDVALMAYVRRCSKFFLLLTLVLGAVTGVGIWFTIGLISPTATSTLIHAFVWAWAIEWVFFFVEIIAALVYYATWDTADRATHLKFAWIYAGAAYLSLVVINGILTFMVTPGRWLETHNFWHAWFNPAAMPSLLLRTGSALALVALFTLWTGARLRDETLRVKVVRYGSHWLLPAFVLMPAGLVWYVAALPERARFIALGGAPVVGLFTMGSLALSALIVAFGWWGARSTPERFSPAFATLLVVMGFLATGTTEWVREASRKPYLIYGYLYSNSVRVADAARLKQESILREAKWSPVTRVTAVNSLDMGRAVFVLQCLSCHEVDGYNPVRPLVRGWDANYIDNQLSHLDTLKGFMPPFIGTADERAALARYLASLNPPVEKP